MKPTVPPNIISFRYFTDTLTDGKTEAKQKKNNRKTVSKKIKAQSNN